jgi:S-disulfanyl-L-cysteine oxidoreductase SoxD
MSTSSRLRACARTAISFAAAGLVATSAVAQPARPDAPRFGFGKPATPAEIAGWDIDVRPDGKGLPAGSGTVAQGQSIYDEKCASCHGTFGESTDYMPIAGGVGTLATDQPIRTTGSKLNHATTLWDYINRAMPFGNPKTLSADEVYALTAYVLHLNDILPADAVLDREAILKVKMPNRDGFTTNHGLAAKSGKPDTHNVACMRNCAGDVRLSSQMPDYARNDHGDLAEQTRPIGPTNGTKRTSAGATKTAAAESRGELAKTAGCTACHGMSQKLVGPAFREIGGRYAGDGSAAERLVTRVKLGSSGSWGTVAMPPQPQLSDAEAKALVRWILDGARSHNQ